MDAKIIEIKSQGSRSGDYIVLGIDNKPINPELPLWQQTDNDTNKPGKIIVRPTAFLVNQPQTAALLMTVRIFSHPIDDDFFLECLYGAGKVRLLYGLPLERNLERREIVFQVKWLYTPGGFFKMTGKELAWRLSWAGGNEFKELGSVDLEIYWLYGNPYDYFPKGIPVETLREIARVLLLSKVFGGHGTFFQKGPVPPEAKIVEQVVNHCFKRNPPRFNTWRGASQFTIPGSQFAGTLLINQYLHSKNDRNALCNCMDQAGVLEYYLKVIGIEEVVVYSLDRFGFLNNVQLVGRGVCNNPYYGAAQGCAREKAVVDENCQDRTFFNNHIFCLWKNNGEWRILDSCIGPFTGGDNKTQYLEKARNANKWPKGDRTKVAWPEDIILPGEPVPRGVCPPGRITFTINQLPGEVEDFFPFAGQGLALRPKGVTWEPPRFLVREWPDIARLQIPGKKGWRLLYKDIVPGKDRVLKTWKLVKGKSTITIHLYISHIDMRPKSLPQSGEWMVEYPKTGGEFHLEKYHNFKIHAYFQDIAPQDESFIEQLKGRLNRLVNDQEKIRDMRPADDLPAVDFITCTNINPRIGEKITVRIPVEVGVHYDFYMQGKGLKHIAENEYKNENGRVKCLDFIVMEVVDKNPAVQLVVLAVHEKKLLLNSKVFGIVVIEEKSA